LSVELWVMRRTNARFDLLWKLMTDEGSGREIVGRINAGEVAGKRLGG
jgi:hypothetical protein